MTKEIKFTVFFKLKKESNLINWSLIVDDFKKIHNHIISKDDISKLIIEDDIIHIGYTQSELHALWFDIGGFKLNFPTIKPLDPIGTLDARIQPNSFSLETIESKRPAPITEMHTDPANGFVVLGDAPDGFKFGNSLIDIIKFNKNYKIVIGEEHLNKTPRDQLISAIESDNKPDFIGLEFLFRDPHQKILDDWMKTPEGTDLPYVFELFVKQRDDEQARFGQKTTLKSILLAAKKNKIRVIALDSEDTLRLQGDERVSALDSLAIKIAREENPDDNKNFILLVGTHHTPAISKGLGANSILFSHNMAQFNLKKVVTDGYNEIQVDHIFDANEIVEHTIGLQEDHNELLTDSLIRSGNQDALKLSASVGIKTKDEELEETAQMREDLSALIANFNPQKEELNASEPLTNSNAGNKANLPEVEENVLSDQISKAISPINLEAGITVESSTSLHNMDGGNDDRGKGGWNYKIIISIGIIATMLAMTLAYIFNRSKN